MRDEINEPLRKTPAPKRAGASPIRFAALAAVALVAVAVVWKFRDFDARREAVPVIASAETGGAPPAIATPRPQTEEAANGLTAVSTSEQIEKASGVKVMRNGGGGPPGALIIDVPQALSVHLTDAPDPRLIEKSKYGNLPRIGADGSRPSEVYSRPVFESAKNRNGPRIAIAVGGLGLDGRSTQAAIQRLPAAISLGFAPYGDDLPSLAAAARRAGHELLLQAPMEGFGGPAPGPHALLASASEAENRDALDWMMSRFPGFIGVQNYLGAKLTSDAKTVAPLLAEISSRGLVYLDDGSSPRSVATSLAAGMNLRDARADIVLDATPTPDAIEIALAKLETLARRQDGAIGVATALPISIDHIAHWAEALEARGVSLTPVSALIGQGSIRSAASSP